jgi:hypothetical protein
MGDSHSTNTGGVGRLRNEDAQILASFLQEELETQADPLPFNWRLNEYIRCEIEKCWTKSNNTPITLETAWYMFTILEKETKDLLGGSGWFIKPRPESMGEEELIDSVISIGKKIELEGD